MVNVIFSLVGSNGDEIVFDNDSNYLLTEGLTGIGIPATSVGFKESASDGALWNSSKRGIREVDLPLVILGETRDEVEINLRRLSNLLQDRRGGTILRASYSGGEVWELQDGHYTGGAETVRGSGSTSHWQRWGITMQFGNPFWVRQEPESISVGSSGSSRSLIPNLAEMRVTGSQVTGNIPIENVGDVDAYPVWKFFGPFDSVQITSQDGLSFKYTGTITAGQSITVDTEKGTVVNQAGVNKYANLSPSPKLFTIPPGASEVGVVAIGSDANTIISLYYQPRKEVVH